MMARYRFLASWLNYVGVARLSLATSIHLPRSSVPWFCLQRAILGSLGQRNDESPGR